MFTNLIVKLRQGSGKGRQGMALKAKGLKLKPLPRAYTKVGRIYFSTYCRGTKMKMKSVISVQSAAIRIVDTSCSSGWVSAGRRR